MLIGRVDDASLPALYSGAEWFVYLSMYEGFGLPPLEAMACGTPVLVSDIEVFKEVVGGAAVTVDCYDVDRIAQSLIAINMDKDLKNEISRSLQNRICKYDWEISARKTYDLLLRYR